MPTAMLLGTSGQGLCVNKPKADDPFQREEPQATAFRRVEIDNTSAQQWFEYFFICHKLHLKNTGETQAFIPRIIIEIVYRLIDLDCEQLVRDATAYMQL